MKYKELCDSIIVSVKSILQDAEELKAKEAKIRADAIDECIYIVAQETHDGNLCDLLEQLKENL